MPLIRIKRVDRRNPSSTWLCKHLSNTYSQIGQDGVLAKVFDILELGESSLSVEFGAWDGMHFSNTANLIKNDKWNGFFIEANKDKFAELIYNYKDEISTGCVTAINQLVHFQQGQGTLDEILSKHAKQCPNFVSIDIDGNDIYILASLAIRPEVLLIEFNPSISNDTFSHRKRAFR